MSDPSLLPDGLAEAGKLVGSAVSGGVITLLLGRLFGSQDKALDQVLAELKVLTASMGGQGGDPDLLLTTLDSGDLIHPNSAGASALATLVNAAAP